MLLPVAGRIPLRELKSAIEEWVDASRDRVTIAWVLLGGINHDAAEVKALAALLGHLPLRINLIDVNDARPNGYRRAKQVLAAEFGAKVGAPPPESRGLAPLAGPGYEDLGREQAIEVGGRRHPARCRRVSVLDLAHGSTIKLRHGDLRTAVRAAAPRW